MIAVINGIMVNGTPEEIMQIIELAKTKSLGNIKIDVDFKNSPTPKSLLSTESGVSTEDVVETIAALEESETIPF